MSAIIADFTVTTTSIATGTYTQFFDTKGSRKYLECPHEGQDYWFTASESAPTSKDNMLKITSGTQRIYDTGVVPIAKIWVYHEAGGNANIKLAEG
jgi:hypothetical protein